MSFWSYCSVDRSYGGKGGVDCLMPRYQTELRPGKVKFTAQLRQQASDNDIVDASSTKVRSGSIERNDRHDLSPRESRP